MEFKSKAVPVIFAGCIVIVAVIVFIIMKATNRSAAPTALVGPVPASDLSLESTAFSAEASVPARYTCDGKGINPPLAISGIPAGTRSLALIVEDPDAPMKVWDHWVVYDIDPSVSVIPEGVSGSGVGSGISSGIGVEGVNSSGSLGYEGPCPPSGSHRYVFTVYALDTKLGLPPGETKDAVWGAMAGHVLGAAALIGVYARSGE